MRGIEAIDKLLLQRLSAAERALLIAERRRVANAERRGRRTASLDFVKSITASTQLSQSTVYRDLRRFDELGTELLERVQGTELDHGDQLDRLRKLSTEERARVVRRTIGKKAP